MPEPSYFLVQISNIGFNVLLNENKYVNNKWMLSIKDKDQGKVKINDFIVTYFTGHVYFLKQQIRYIFEIKEILNNNNELKLSLYSEIRPIKLQEIRKLVSYNLLSRNFSYCGQQGFNICKISENDFKEIYSRKIIGNSNYDNLRLELKRIDDIENYLDILEKQSDMNLLYQYKDKLDELPKRKILKFIESGYIIVKNNKMELSKQGLYMVGK
jgi:hypothetical protein